MHGSGMAERTVKTRIETLDLFARRCHCDPMTAGWLEASEFIGWPGLARTTQHNYYRTLKAWFTYLIQTEQRTDNPILKLRAPKVPRAMPRPVTDAQLATVLSSGMYRRTRMMILLAAFQGLRVHEIAKMRGELIMGERLRVIGKGGADVQIPLHAKVAELADRFPRIGLWFPAWDDPARPILSRSVGSTISKAMRRAGVDATAHQLRHYYGTHVMRESGGDIRVAQEALRHASISSTAIYTEVTFDQLRAVIDRLPVPLHVVRSRSS